MASFTTLFSFIGFHLAILCSFFSFFVLILFCIVFNLHYLCTRISIEINEMRLFKRYLPVFLLFVFCLGVSAQDSKWRDVYKAKKKDTLFGIARKYGISLPELMEANPEMKQEGYELKKGAFVFIPFSKDDAAASKAAVARSAGSAQSARTSLGIHSPLRIGVMLPLHDVDGDGRRMVEYYRGILLACDELKGEGISTDIRAWNVPIDADIRQTLLQEGANECDLIFGPLYTRQVAALGSFCRTYGIKLVIPFSINGDEVLTNPQVFQVYQSVDALNNAAIDAFMERFQKAHPIFIDCNDTTSRKAPFTFGLRNRLEQKGIRYSITNLKSSEELFAKAFSRKEPNVVILNTGRSPELNVALAKLNGLTTAVPGLKISLFGYTEWLMYVNNYLDYYYKYDTYIPTNFYYNPLSDATKRFETSYRRWFHGDMMWALPHFAITGYDQAQFFIRGLLKKGKSFTGTPGEVSVTPLQTPLKFKRISSGGYQNEAFMLVHYTPGETIEAVNY